MFALILLFLSISNLAIDLSFVSGQSEKELLLELKTSLTYESSTSTKLVHWNESVDLCQWPGVECSSRGSVSGLDLSGESISDGIITLFSLTHLQSLSLAQNTFSLPEFPSGFGQLTELRYLNLSRCGFSGQIPSDLSNLTRLVVLDLSVDFFSSLNLPNLYRLIHAFSSLKELHLDGVNVSANGNEWGSAISSSMSNLTVLGMSGCFLRGPLDSSLLKLQSLSVIRLDGNTFSSPFPGFLAEFPNLKVLTLSSCDLSGVVPAKLFRIKTLQTVDLSNNRNLQGSLPEFPANGSLENLMLSYTRFSGNVTESIGNLRMMSNLDVRSCNFSGLIPSTIKNLNLLVYLDLSQNQFSGSVPSFAFLKNLNVLNLYSNRLEGEVSDSSWKGLENLEFLHLGENSLKGEIPPSLFALPMLKSLHLSNNSFSGSIKLSTSNTSSPLEVLEMSLNNLEGSIPRIFFELKNLSSLIISSNNFSGSIHLTDFSKLTNLASLDLSYNKLSVHVDEETVFSKLFPRLGSLMLAHCNLQKVPSLKNQSSLMMLDLSNNVIEGEIPSWMWEGNLRFLNISHNRFSRFQEPYDLRALDYINVHANVIVGMIPSPFSSAVVLDFSSNRFSSISPDVGDSLHRAIFFSAADNQIAGEIPRSFCNATGLHVLDLSNNSFHGGIPSCLVNNNLEVLNLRRNNLDGAIPDAFPVECSLETLDLSRNVLKGKVPKSLNRCSELKVLDLTSNTFNDTFPCWINTLSSLRVLALRSNMFHGDMNCLGDTNSSWRNLQIFNIASNYISGAIPAEMFEKLQALTDASQQQQQQKQPDYLHFSMETVHGVYYQDSVTVVMKNQMYDLEKIQTIFTSIDFSDNNLQGAIPPTIGSLQSLYILNFSHNAFSGHIPPSLANVSKLQSFDLSFNALVGEIPGQLADLTSLGVLNLSYNHLVGRIPQGKQFNTFTESSYVGNEGLCGFPLNRNCSEKGASQPGEVQGEEEDNVFDRGMYVNAALGFVVGVGIIVAPLLLCKKWRNYYNKHLTRFAVLVLPQQNQKSTGKW
ncbi:hypothetical protein SASPL_110097 [Salvia splendens]|uniref:Leucine-rich repeat-containing N-terminal plant-type domain-containing protein n=1 Tax=Salvia splendens TaxID=180675 RepID=A0A8X8Y740_SALSN|nr:receptor-like protein 7 [Salvia splendens]KAG6425889.1 hypothetical protein SASPL_110097 [Salvia splendens]